MRERHRTCAGILWVVLAAVGLPAFAASGRVVDPEGKPIPGARVCHVQFGIEQICSMVKADGTFEIMDQAAFPLRAVADGYFPEERPGVGHHDPIVLRLAPVLIVRLVDAESGEPIEKAEVFVRYDAKGSGKEKGPFPARRAGVRIQRVLEPGQVWLIGRAEGYEDSAPHPASLEGGKETEVVLELARRKAEHE